MTKQILSASVAMSWLWGLGFFFSIHFSQAYGWTGLLLFAIPNALGLCLFGLGLQHLSANHDLRNWIETRIGKTPLLFLSYQIVLISLTVFAISKYVFAGLGSESSVLWGLILVFAGILLAETLGFAGIARLHLIYYGVLLAFAFFLIVQTPLPDSSPVRQPYDLTFAGFAVPLAAGLLFGPWLDLQQWQRAISMKESNINIARGFALGGLLFFILLLVLGGLSILLVPEGIAPAISALDGRGHSQAALTETLQALEGRLPITAFIIVSVIAMLSTLDSAHLALRWYAKHRDRTTDSPLYAMIPPSVRTSTLPAFATAVIIAFVALLVGADLEHFMVFYGTVFLANSIVLVLVAFRPSAVPASPSVALMLSAASVAVMMIGYFEHAPAAMILAALIPLLIFVPLFRKAVSLDGLPIPKAATPALAGVPAGIGTTTDPAPAIGGSAPAPVRDADPPPASESGPPSEGWVQDGWFTIKLVPTYSDTNSTGNVYFASYITWVGKARELFFRFCMPDFDVDSTDFYILTRSFNHKFYREIREFDPVEVRLRISNFNRKFVKLEHQIINAEGKPIGAGDQTLMFVESQTYGLIDIPGKVYAAFAPYTPARKSEKI